MWVSKRACATGAGCCAETGMSRLPKCAGGSPNRRPNAWRSGTGEYPAIRDNSALLEAVEACGYETEGHFPLPASAWWDDYYRPLQDNVIAFRKRHRDEPDALEAADRCQHEIDIWHACSEFYGYEFLVLRLR